MTLELDPSFGHPLPPRPGLVATGDGEGRLRVLVLETMARHERRCDQLIHDFRPDLAILLRPVPRDVALVRRFDGRAVYLAADPRLRQALSREGALDASLPDGSYDFLRWSALLDKAPARPVRPAGPPVASQIPGLLLSQVAPAPDDRLPSCEEEERIYALLQSESAPSLVLYLPSSSGRTLVETSDERCVAVRGPLVLDIDADYSFTEVAF